MELMYFCLSLGYKGQYRSTEFNQHQLEQIVDNLYKHIRLFRGHITKALSHIPLKATKVSGKPVAQKEPVGLKLTYVTVCVVMSIFISLGYLMDVISNEAYKNITHFENVVSHETRI
jgi:type VI secretion system protein ImpK